MPDRDVIINKTLPYIILAKVFGITQTITSPTTGATDLFLVEQDEEGLDKRTKLGRNLTDLFENLDVLNAQRFEASVNKMLSTEYQHQDKRTAAQSLLRDELKSVLAERRNDIEDPIYKRFEDATRKGIQLLKAK